MTTMRVTARTTTIAALTDDLGTWGWQTRTTTDDRRPTGGVQPQHAQKLSPPRPTYLRPISTSKLVFH